MLPCIAVASGVRLPPGLRDVIWWEGRLTRSLHYVILQATLIPWLIDDKGAMCPEEHQGDSA